MRILITGANGFVGSVMCAAAVKRGYSVRGVTRVPCDLAVGVENVVVGTIDANTGWQDTLTGCDVVIHLAARVHIMSDNSSDPLAEFRRVNTAGTERLARSAAACGVKRLVFVSSIGVNGLSTNCDARFSELDTPNPHNAYALSKWEAEQALHNVQKETGLEVVVVRPPLVYGALAPGNFEQLMRVVARGVPLPFASANNRRDLVYVGNLVDALIVCASNPAAAGQTYLVSDGESVSTPGLLRNLADAMGVTSRVFPFPLMLLKLAGKVMGKSDQIERLLGSLQVDSGKIHRELDWNPPYTLHQGMKKTVSAFIAD